MKKIRIAQIGVNRFSHSMEIFHTLKVNPDIFDIAGYALVEDERETCADKIKEFDGYKELTLDEILNDESIEAVTVETDEIHLLKYAIMAAEHGKHIHMEKPGSQSVSDFERLVSIVRKSGKVLHLGYMYRYNPYVSDAIKRVRDGELGEIYSVEAHMSRTDGPVVRDWLNSFKGGMMFYLGCHLIDLVMLLQGVPEEVIPLNAATGYGDINSEDFGLAMMKYPRGYSMVRTAATEIGGFDRRQLVIMGERGTIEIRPLEINVQENKASRFATQATKREVILDDNQSRVTNVSTADQFDRYDAMIRAFAAMVRGEKINPYTLDYELELFKTILKCCGIK